MALGTVRSGEAQTYYACAQERLEKFKNGAPSMSCTESPYLDRLEEVEQKYEITPHD